MDKLRVASVQMEHAGGDKAANLAKIEEFARLAAAERADAIAFPECCISGYMHLAGLTYEGLCDLAEEVPGGMATATLQKLAARHGITVLAGLLEIDRASGGKLYNTYVAAGPDGSVVRYRKLHPFVNRHLSAGSEYVIFDLKGWKAGILICYDCNLWENWRICELRGAQVMFLPHQTGGFDIPCAGMGRISPELWLNREKDPGPISREVLGFKGREWLMKWLPSRAYDSGMYTVFSNGCGIDGQEEVRSGGAVIFDCHGLVLQETFALHDDMVVADLDPKELELNLGRSHTTARRPELYAELADSTTGSAETREMRNEIRRKLGVKLNEG